MSWIREPGHISTSLSISLPSGTEQNYRTSFGEKSIAFLAIHHCGDRNTICLPFKQGDGVFIPMMFFKAGTVDAKFIICLFYNIAILVLAGKVDNVRWRRRRWDQYKPCMSHTGNRMTYYITEVIFNICGPNRPSVIGQWPLIEYAPLLYVLANLYREYSVAMYIICLQIGILLNLGHFFPFIFSL